MANDISSRITQLPKMATPALRDLWRQVFSNPPHPKMRRELMIPVLAYRIQEQVQHDGFPSQSSMKSGLTQDFLFQ